MKRCMVRVRFLLLALALPAFADPVVSVDLIGVQIKNAALQNKIGAPMQLDPSAGYMYAVDGMVKGAGPVLGLLLPNPTPLADMLGFHAPGSSSLLSGTAMNPGGTHPFVGFEEMLDGPGALDFLGLLCLQNEFAGGCA